MSGLYVAEFTSRRINAEANTCASTKSAKRLTSCKSGTHSNMKRRDSPDCPYKNYLALFFILNHLRMFPHQPQPTAPAPGSSRQLQAAPGSWLCMTLGLKVEVQTFPGLFQRGDLGGSIPCVTSPSPITDTWGELLGMSVGFENQLLQVAESPDGSLAVHIVRAESSVRIKALYFHLVLVWHFATSNHQNLFNKKHVHLGNSKYQSCQLSLKCKTSAICDFIQDMVG